MKPADSLNSFYRSTCSILFIFQPRYGMKEYLMLISPLYLVLKSFSHLLKYIISKFCSPIISINIKVVTKTSITTINYILVSSQQNIHFFSREKVSISFFICVLCQLENLLTSCSAQFLIIYFTQELVFDIFFLIFRAKCFGESWLLYIISVVFWNWSFTVNFSK